MPRVLAPAVRFATHAAPPKVLAGRLTTRATLATLLTILAAASLATGRAAAAAAAADSKSAGERAAPAPRSTIRLVPRSDLATGPRLANEREVVAAVMLPMMDSGIVADGTVYASLRLGADGRVALLGDFYGAAYTANAQLQRWLIDATALARFDVPPAWRAAHTSGRWVVFWIFQSNGCRPVTFDAPANATTIRVCIAVLDGRARPGASSYLVDTNVVVEPYAPQPLFAGKRVPGFVGSGYSSGGRAGEVTLRVTLDERGRVVARETLATTVGDAYEFWLAGWQRLARYDLPPGWPAPGAPRTTELRIAFGIAALGATHCAWVLPMYAGDDHRVCVSSPW